MDGRTVWAYSTTMHCASQDEPNSNSPSGAAALPDADAPGLVRWQSIFGLVIIEVRGERVFVNGEMVESARQEEKGNT